MIKLKSIYEDIYAEYPPEKPEQDIPGYRVTNRSTDAETGRSMTELEPEPKLLAMAKEISKYIKLMKYYQTLPDTPENDEFRSQVASIVTSLKNSEGKLRNLQFKMDAFKSL